MNIFQRDFHVHSKRDRSHRTGDGQGSAQPQQNKWGPENPPVHKTTMGQRRAGSCLRASMGLQRFQGARLGSPWWLSLPFFAL